ncbi:rhodanese-like domain-containing protein [Maritimibacter sp. 55A14]|uniref:rhodanese-like domain-containing protein n=1 Tax=Maritimibacter sp. 55A14 TaxID=2174844 RepID=UPI000D608CC5|nr:rhodanese-like domain-containing protein [Maritimibacter sp. 55A14]PWE32908.1 rhodanese-like domain-containing protein [Maritimibacter sp. 55A14]
MKTIDRDGLKQKIYNHEPMKLIEVLPQESFEDFHLPGAINIPVGSEKFEERVQAAAEKDEQVIVYCMNEECDASPKAAKRMEALGFTNVLDYAAGKEDWRSADLPVE